MEVEEMKAENLQEIALFRFSLIAPIVNNSYTSKSKTQYFKEIASKEHKLPNGKVVKLSSMTIKKWYLSYC